MKLQLRVHQNTQILDSIGGRNCNTIQLIIPITVVDQEEDLEGAHIDRAGLLSIYIYTLAKVPALLCRCS